MFGGPVTIAVGAGLIYLGAIWMIWIRFYYYSFLRFYTGKGEDWIPWFRSLLLVELTFFSLILFIWQLIDPNALKGIPFLRLYNIIFNILLLILLHQLLAARGKSEEILEEFTDHPWDTKSNRIICWVIWTVTFLVPGTLTVINHGINWTRIDPEHLANMMLRVYINWRNSDNWKSRINGWKTRHPLVSLICLFISNKSIGNLLQLKQLVDSSFPIWKVHCQPTEY